MTKDRLKALQSVASSVDEQRLNSSPGNGSTGNGGTLGPRLEPGVNPAFSVDEEYNAMDAFFKQVEEARALTRSVKEHVKEMRRLHSQVLSSPRPDHRTKEELERRSAEVKSAVKKVSHILKVLERGLDSSGGSGPAAHAAAARIRRTQHSTCLHLLVEAITEFNNEQEDYKNKCEERIKRVISIAKVEVSDEKLENLMETGNFGSIFNGDIITETLEAKQALEDVTARHQEIVKLEKSIRDLRDMFVEMSLLVERQGDLVDNIERQVLQTREHVEVANITAKKAVKYQSKFRHKRWCLYIAAAVVLLILVLVIVFQFVPNHETTKEASAPSPASSSGNRSLSLPETAEVEVQVLEAAGATNRTEVAT